MESKKIKEVIRHVDKTLTIVYKNGKSERIEDKIEANKKYKQLHNIKL